MKLFNYFYILIFLSSCAQFKNIDRAPAFAFSAQPNLCNEAFDIYFKYRADPADIAEDLLIYRQEQGLPVVLDIGGEGRYQGAINLNPQPLTSTTGQPERIIPNWVPGVGSDIPLGRRTVDIIYLENAPLTTQTMDEMLRVMRPRGNIHLSHPTEYEDTYLQNLKKYFGKQNINRTYASDGVISKFEILLP